MSVILDLLVPPRCLGCLARSRDGLCTTCAADLEDDGVPHRLAPGVLATAVFAYEDPLAGAIKRVKTDGMREGARHLATIIDPHLPRQVPRTWVPAPRRRARRRGLDLPEVLAGPQATRLLSARAGRRDQGGLSAKDRRRSAIGAFEAHGRVPQRLVLVDDVRATGATLLAAARALQAAGAQRVLAITLAGAAGAPSAARQAESGRW
ncbi:ComF family protein [Euzebya tangerina]|uniref:ComF family protein n=1 Tax=Euzebya tangerina TaxID=591198 RepID=UPI0013C2A8E1|nr:phosphoribosyltransferase family protein [Euzebya tangerina]